MTGRIRAAWATVATVALVGCGPSGPDPVAGATSRLDATDAAGPQVVFTDVELPAGERIVAAAIGAELVARTAPSAGADEVGRFANPRPTGGPLVVLVAGPVDGDWLEVLLPMRPNGTTGWIAAGDVELSRTPYRIEIDTDDHRLVVYERNNPIVETTVAIGTGATPTPIGSFYLTELLRPPDPTGPYGTHAFGLSGFSETLQSFNGGDGVIGLHGTNDPASLGTDVSHGCVRIANDTIDELARVLPLGTPVEIR
ncbi:MAG: L,D-transpeptidase family protein [Acidimicrobiia bacterium]|nr:L,D-transpeptidase family protein [Acidimicrobiia bacterium]